ncbi:MAG: UDP-N-acetylmuramoyl-L-alanine--D-glutamate ligase, partial [Patescibacteria group bacterium]
RFPDASLLQRKPQCRYASPVQSDLRGIIGILGFGVDGQAVAEFLETQPEVKEVRVFDDEARCQVSGVRCQKGTSLDGVSLLFRSPGFRLTHPLIAEAKKRGIPITSSTTYFLQHFPDITVGITGSNGKTTCTSLIAEMLRAQFGKERVEEGGNDRKPRLDLLTTNYSLLTTTYVVLELSSFQLIDCPLSPDVAVVLNITPNHLDWHKDMHEYIEAKRRIVAHQRGGEDGEEERRRGDIAILNQDDPIVKTFAEGLKGDVHWFNDLSTVHCPLSILKFKTNPDTLCAAVTAARALGVAEENIVKVLETFRGAPHRIEFVRELDSVKWHNDSSCTTPESAITACEAFPVGSLILLLGGRDKGMDFAKLYEVIRKRKVRVVPYGEMAETFAKNIPKDQLCENSQFSILNSQFLQIVEAARKNAHPGDNVVLSPACASFDMFASAKERGGIFEEIVRAL